MLSLIDSMLFPKEISVIVYNYAIDTLEQHRHIEFNSIVINNYKYLYKSNQIFNANSNLLHEFRTIDLNFILLNDVIHIICKTKSAPRRKTDVGCIECGRNTICDTCIKCYDLTIPNEMRRDYNGTIITLYTMDFKPVAYLKTANFYKILACKNYIYVLDKYHIFRYTIDTSYNITNTCQFTNVFVSIVYCNKLYAINGDLHEYDEDLNLIQRIALPPGYANNSIAYLYVENNKLILKKYRPEQPIALRI